jgi:hypothetical protein
MKMTAGGSTQSDIDAILAKIEHMVRGPIRSYCYTVTMCRLLENNGLKCRTCKNKGILNVDHQRSCFQYKMYQKKTRRSHSLILNGFVYRIALWLGGRGTHPISVSGLAPLLPPFVSPLHACVRLSLFLRPEHCYFLLKNDP